MINSSSLTLQEAPVLGKRTYLTSDQAGHFEEAQGKSKRRQCILGTSLAAHALFVATQKVDKLIADTREEEPLVQPQAVREGHSQLDLGLWIRLCGRFWYSKGEHGMAHAKELDTIHLTNLSFFLFSFQERIGSATDVLKAILNPVVNGDEEISWPPRDPEALILMEKELEKKEQEGLLDEGFLSEVNAQLRQAKEDGDKPGLEAMLQKVLQVYASKILAKRSYANKGGKVLIAEKFLEAVIQAPENQWNKLLIDGLSVGKGEVPAEEFYTVIKKRIERVLIRTEGGSYEQRILVEYLRGIQSRTEEIVRALQGPPT
ncbi:hypothetical protein ZIOFF_026196 [Zingiber officinale]|uniref:Uncharacterized protein n=1 Tax=Zingiber officinale TaxID=94328 RepID=A0A8J5H396_ZINOF|nr:hypothetical protein ZIOFF_026196 [Zingiber officinale]